MTRLPVVRRSTTALAALLLAVLALAVVGCGGEEVTATPETVEGEIPTDTGPAGDLPALELTGDAANGESIFASSGCGGCHTLAAAGAAGAVGPNLDEAKPSYELVVERVTLGLGGMPAFGDQLEPQEIADVAQYVADSAGG
jgi:mono/diheme cytochrome c family protein